MADGAVPRRHRRRRSTLKEFTEQSAVAYPAHVRRAAPPDHPPRGPAGCAHAVLDAGAGGVRRACSRWNRRMDELAGACGIDPVELRLRNEPDVHPETGQPFSSRHLTACLREGAARFGWAGRDPAPGRAARRALELAHRAPASPPRPTRPARCPGGRG